MEITTAQSKKLSAIGKKYRLTLLLLHGSYATGKQHPGSDLDIAYLTTQPLSHDRQLKLHSDLADVFGDSRQRELDLKSLVHADPLFQYEVTRDSQLLFGERDTYDDFRAHAAIRYRDSQDIFALEDKLLTKLHRRLMTNYAQ